MTYPSALPTGGDQLTAILDEELIDAATPTGGPLGAGEHSNGFAIKFQSVLLTFNHHMVTHESALTMQHFTRYILAFMFLYHHSECAFPYFSSHVHQLVRNVVINCTIDDPGSIYGPLYVFWCSILSDTFHTINYFQICM